MKKTILIVDDDESLANAISIELKAAGFEVVVASDGDIGFSGALSHKPDLVLLDIHMPKLDGLMMLKKLRSHSDTYCKSVPVLILSNLDSEDVIKQATDLQCDDFLVKTDTSLTKLVEIIQKKLQ